FDEPRWLVLLFGAGAVGLTLAVVVWLRGGGAWAGLPLVVGLAFGASGATYLYTTRIGKFAVWAELLSDLGLRGDERVLDMGCGRGAVLLQAGRLVPAGRAVGIDLWRDDEQSGNSPAVTRRNAALEGVEDRVELHTGDMAALPFEDASFDVVLSSRAFHNMPGTGRASALA